MGNSIFHLSLELLRKFWKKELESCLTEQLIKSIVWEVAIKGLLNCWPKSQAEG